MQNLLPGLQTGAHVTDMQLASLPLLRGMLSPPRSSGLIASAMPNRLPMVLPPETVTLGVRASAWVWGEGMQRVRPMFLQYSVSWYRQFINEKPVLLVGSE